MLTKHQESFTITLSRIIHFLYFQTIFPLLFGFLRTIIFLVGRIITEFSTETDLTTYNEIFVLIYGLNLLSGISNFHFLRVFIINFSSFINFLKIRDNLKENSRLYLIGFHAKLFFSFFLSPFFVKSLNFRFLTLSKSRL